MSMPTSSPGKSGDAGPATPSSARDDYHGDQWALTPENDPDYTFDELYTGLPVSWPPDKELPAQGSPSFGGREFSGGHLVGSHKQEDTGGGPASTARCTGPPPVKIEERMFRILNKRTYHPDRYVMQYWAPNDNKHKLSLDVMHDAFTMGMDGKLHLAPLNYKWSNFPTKVLDMGTGSGIWASHFAREYPLAKVLAMDISPTGRQPSQTQANLRFGVQDCNKRWHVRDGFVDYVHMRGLAGGIRDWNYALAEAFRCLGPGGWVESFEIDYIFEADDGTLPKDSALAKWGRILIRAARKSGSQTSFTVVRDRLQYRGLREAGFRNICEKYTKLPIGTWHPGRKSAVIGGLVKTAIEDDTEGYINYSADMIGWSPGQIKAYADLVKQEMDSRKIHAYMRQCTAWAQKPLI